MFLEPIPNPDDIQNLYSEQYFKSHNIQYLQGLDEAAIESRIRLVQEGVKQEVHPFKNKGKMLEVGCASGFFLKAAERLGWDVTGVELSQFASTFASKRLGLKIINSRLEEANLPKNYFDVITMFMVLEHTLNPLDTLKTAKAHLKPGGIIIFKVPNFRCLESLIFGNKWHQLSFPYHLYIFSPLSIIKLNSLLGFKILKLSTYRHFSNYINPVTQHLCGKIVQKSVVLKEKKGILKNILRFLYKKTFSLIDERMLFGEQLRVVLQKKE